MKDLLNEIDNAEDEVKVAVEEVTNAVSSARGQAEAPELARKRAELLRLSED